MLGEVAARSLARRQFYVGNTRYRGAHAIYLSSKDDILRRLAQRDSGRELATEFMESHGLGVHERTSEHRRRDNRTRLRTVLRRAAARVHATHETIRTGTGA